MAIAKKQDELDFTNQPQATNQAEVDAQDTKTRLYQSLGYTYGQQQKQSDESYNKAISQQDRSLLARGMQRSSYGAQTLANLQNQKVKERNRIGEAWIADYQNRMSQLEEAEAARQFQTSERKAQQEWQSGENALQREQTVLDREQNASQFAEQMALQREQNAQTQANWEIQQAFQEKQWQAQQDQWRTEFDYNKMTDDQKIAFTVITAAAGNGTDVSDDVLKRAGISRADYNAMKKQAAATSGANNPGSSKPWEKAGMTEAEWNAMKAAGFTDPTKYRDYILEQAGKNGNKVGSVVAKASSNTTPKVTKPTDLSKEYK